MLCFPSKKLAADISLHMVCCWQLFCQKTVCRLKSASGEDKGGDKRGIKEREELKVNIFLKFGHGFVIIYKVVFSLSQTS